MGGCRLHPELSACWSPSHTESGTGSDVSSMKTRAVKDGASWVLNGAKIYITFGSVAHFIQSPSNDFARSAR